jgi:hypothetical protein
MKFQLIENELSTVFRVVVDAFPGGKRLEVGNLLANIICRGREMEMILHHGVSIDA